MSGKKFANATKKYDIDAQFTARLDDLLHGSAVEPGAQMIIQLTSESELMDLREQNHRVRLDAVYGEVGFEDRAQDHGGEF